MEYIRIKAGFLLFFFCILFFLGPVSAQSNKSEKSGPLPAPKVKGLPEFLKLLVFSSRNIAEGDFGAAIEVLKKAEKIHPDDPMLLEYFGLAYDGDRDQKTAFKYFLRAGNEYFKMSNIEKSWKMIGWLNTIDSKSDKLKEFEKKVRKKQLELNNKRKTEKK